MKRFYEVRLGNAAKSCKVTVEGCSIAHGIWLAREAMPGERGDVMAIEETVMPCYPGQFYTEHGWKDGEAN